MQAQRSSRAHIHTHTHPGLFPYLLFSCLFLSQPSLRPATFSFALLLLNYSFPRLCIFFTSTLHLFPFILSFQLLSFFLFFFSSFGQGSCVMSLTLQCFIILSSRLWTQCNTLQHTSEHCNTPWHCNTRCNTHCNEISCWTHCNTMQNTAALQLKHWLCRASSVCAVDDEDWYWGLLSFRQLLGHICIWVSLVRLE